MAGYLTPSSGTAKVFASRQGTVSAVYVEQGQKVDAGQRLLTVATGEVDAHRRRTSTPQFSTPWSSKGSPSPARLPPEVQRTASERERLTAQIQRLEDRAQPHRPADGDPARAHPRPGAAGRKWCQAHRQGPGVGHRSEASGRSGARAATGPHLARPEDGGAPGQPHRNPLQPRPAAVHPGGEDPGAAQRALDGRAAHRRGERPSRPTSSGRRSPAASRCCRHRWDSPRIHNVWRWRSCRPAARWKPSSSSRRARSASSRSGRRSGFSTTPFRISDLAPIKARSPRSRRRSS